jgi:hypothetical protein
VHTHVLRSTRDERYEKILGHDIFFFVMYIFGAPCGVFIIIFVWGKYSEN